MKNVKKEYYINGLGCASCSAKMEREIRKIEDVRFVSVDYMTKKMLIEYDIENRSEQSILKNVESSIKKIEADIYLKQIDEKKDKKSKKQDLNKNIFKRSMEDPNILKEITIIGISLILLIVSFIHYFKQYEFIICLIAYILVGFRVLKKTGSNIRNKNYFDENFLMTLATLVAFAIGQYHEGVAVMLFYRVGELLQQMAVDKSRESLKSLLDIQPEEARLVTQNITIKTPIESIRPKDIIQVFPGERIPLDGIITYGESRVDLSSITGESMPVDVKAGDEVLSGCVNQTGFLTLEVTKTNKESTASKILQLVENAAHKKSKTEKFITKFARYYTPAVLLAAALIAIIPTLVFLQPAEKWIYRSLVFIVISCPCALVLSVPLCYFGAIGTASKNGIIIKGSQYIEALENAKTVIFDKTGTLTKGEFEIISIESHESSNKENVIKYAAYAEEKSNHPIAESIKKEFKKKNKVEIFAESYNEFPGGGVVAKFDFGEISVGNSRLMKTKGIKNIPDIDKNENNTAVYVALEQNYIGRIVLSDKPKLNAKYVIKELEKAGIENVYMLTGDRQTEAEYIGKSVGVKKENIYSNLRPEQKLDIYGSIKEKSNKSAIFVGDGMNDAPVLVRSDVGISMGIAGSDAAIEASDVVITNDEIMKIPESIYISKYSKKLAYQNIAISLGVKFIIMILGIFGHATMWEAVFADVGVTIIAVLNAQRILMYKPKSSSKNKIINTGFCNKENCASEHPI